MIENILAELKAAENPSVIKRYEKTGVTQAYIGVMMGEVQRIAKRHKQQTEWALPLWRTGILEAQLVAIELFDAQRITSELLSEFIDEQVSLLVLDKLADRVLTQSPHVMAWSEQLKAQSSLLEQRIGWRLETFLVKKKQRTTEEMEALLQHIERHLAKSDELVRWVMNQCFVEIAVNYPDYLQHCLTLATQLGVYRDMKVAKGCTSAYAPDWIHALLKNCR